MSSNDGNPTLGFVGLGVMREPMCRNLAKKSGLPVVAFDLRSEPLQRAAEDGVESAASLADLAARTNIIFLSLPGEPQVRAVVQGPEGLLAQMRAGQTSGRYYQHVPGRTGPRNRSGVCGEGGGLRRCARSADCSSRPRWHAQHYGRRHG